MGTLPIPATGLSLSISSHPHEKEGDALTQILRLDLSESRARDLLNALKSKKKVSLQTGNRSAIQYGEKKVLLQTSSESFPSEFYLKSHDTDKGLYFSGKLSHVLEMQQAREVTSKSDEALATLENTLRSLKEERAQNEVSFLQSKDDMRVLNKKDPKPSPLLGSGLRKDHLIGGVTRSTPSSPYLGAARSPNHAPTSAPLPAGGFGLVNKDRVRLEAIKIPLIHLVASHPMSSKAASEKIRAPREDCDNLLDKYAQDSVRNVGKQELRDKTYKDLDVWKFPYPSEDDRKAAVNRAVHAFDRMRLDKNDPIWQLLLPSAERGKGKILSRLNLNKHASSQSLLRPERAETKGEPSDREGSGSPHKKIAATKKAAEKQSSTGPTAEAKPKVRPVSPAVGKKREISQARGPKIEGKFKSAERIEDSDEEAGDSDVIPAKPKSIVKKEPHAGTPSHSSPKRNLSPKKQAHKSNLSQASSGSDSSDNQTSNKSLKPPTRDQPLKHSPRPRHDSSPQKPSPLGSSPPANSTDFDSSSSSKQSQSSAPSSPPSSTEMPIAKQKQKFSPIITDKSRDVSRGRAPVKRKSDEMEGSPAAKRQQVNGVKVEKLSNGIKGSEERPALERKSTDSDHSSTSEKGPPARAEVIDEAKRFQLYYKKYKDLHEKLELKPEKERDQKDMDNLLNMHKRLKEMKAEIWGNWGKVEKAVAT
jgi:RNA polymerase II elongation factor ELL